MEHIATLLINWGEKPRAFQCNLTEGPEVLQDEAGESRSGKERQGAARSVKSKAERLSGEVEEDTAKPPAADQRKITT